MQLGRHDRELVDRRAIQYPQGAASAVLLVVALMLGVFTITRFSNLREEL